MAVAIFDLDGTILNSDSDELWGDFLSSKGIVDGDEFKRKFKEFGEEYNAGTLNIIESYGYLLALISKIDIKTLVKLREEFMESHILPNLQKAALERIKWHRNWGDKIVIVSATHRFLAQASTLCIKPDALLATEPEAIDGFFTGKVIGVPTFKEGKAVAIESWLAKNKQNLQDSWGYGDSVNDIPMLNLCKYRVAVDPDKLLLAHAKANNFRIMSFKGA